MPMMGNPLDDLNRSKLQGNFFVGFVVNNVDEDDKKQRQRVRIRIPQLHRNVPDDKLPWAIPDNTQGVGNAQIESGSQVGSVNIPQIGAKIYVRIDDNDPHNPRYSGSPSTDDVSKGNELLDEQYPHTRGTIDAANNRRSVNVEKQTQQETHSSGTTVHIDANGNYSLTVAGDLNIGVQGTINMVAKGNVNIQGQNVNINEGGQTPGPVTPRSRPQPKDVSGMISY